jgi:hypothetical protein
VNWVLIWRVSKTPRESDGNQWPSRQKLRQKFLWANGERIRLEAELNTRGQMHDEEMRKLKATHADELRQASSKFDLDECSEVRDHCEKKRRTAEEKLRVLEAQLSVLTPLQIEAFRLAKEMRAFLAELGSRPMVNRSDFPGDIQGHLDAQHEAERPWELKLKSGYRTRFAKRIEDIMDRFGDAGLDAYYRLNAWTKSINSEVELTLCAQALDDLSIGLNAISEVRYTRIQVDAMTGDELGAKMKSEPGFANLVAYYQETKRR